MAISLYEGSVATYLQTVIAVGGFLAKGLAHCRDNGVDPETLVDARLFPDMHPFRFQVQSVAFHSKGALDGMAAGVFRPWLDRPAHAYAGLQAFIAETEAALRAYTPAAVDALEGRAVVFEAGGTRRQFTAETFLLSFSLPNFHFHATTAYDILRSSGVSLGKRDYMGPLRVAAPAD